MPRSVAGKGIVIIAAGKPELGGGLSIAAARCPKVRGVIEGKR